MSGKGALCGWCLTNMHENCKPEGDEWLCHCPCKKEE